MKVAPACWFLTIIRCVLIWMFDSFHFIDFHFFFINFLINFYIFFICSYNRGPILTRVECVRILTFHGSPADYKLCSVLSIRVDTSQVSQIQIQIQNISWPKLRLTNTDTNKEHIWCWKLRLSNTITKPVYVDGNLDWQNWSQKNACLFTFCNIWGMWRRQPN